MTTLQFLKLIKTIYKDQPPNLEYIQRLGLLAIKIGQMHALRVDFLTPESCRELAKLYRQTQSIPQESVDALLESYAGEGFLNAFSEFSKTPFASASIGQVHKATLTSGESVAVKLVKKEFTKDFAKDVQNVKRLFKILTTVYPPLRGVANPVSLLETIERMTTKELDLRNERDGHHTLERIFSEHKDRFDFKYLTFNKLYDELSSEHILVSGLLRGETLDELLSEDRLDYGVLLELFRIHGFYLFYIGTYHGDIHPGNIIYADDKLYLLDTGYVAQVSKEMRKGLFDFFLSLSQYDYDQCVDSLQMMSKTKLSTEKLDTFRKDFKELYKDFKGASLKDISLTTKMMRTLRMAIIQGMSFDEEMFDVIKSFMYMDGMALRCQPDAVLVEDMRPALQEFKPLMDTL